MFKTHFPCVVDRGTAAVGGEVYEVNEITLRRLDRLEGVGVMYRRRRIAIIVGQEIHHCWMYIWLDSVEGLVEINAVDSVLWFE